MKQTKLHYPIHFVEVVVSHLMKTRAAAFDHRLHPGVLVVQGPSGSGKSSGLRHVAKTVGASFSEIHGKDMAAPFEGEAILPLQNAYIAAAEAEDSDLKLLNIDDADMGNLRVDEKYTGTNNSHHVTAFVMRLIEFPFHLRIEQEERLGKPKPPAREYAFKNPPALVMTANNTDVLHSPLVREARANFVTLDPRGRDLEMAVLGMYPHLDENEAQNLVQRYKDKSVAFFAELGNVAANRIALRRARACGNQFKGFDWQAFSHDLAEAAQGASYEALLTAAAQLAGHHHRRNFLAADYERPTVQPGTDRTSMSANGRGELC